MKRLLQKNKKHTPPESEAFSESLFRDLDKNLTNIKKMMDTPVDLVIREFPIGNSGHRCAIMYIAGLANEDLINNQILKNIQLTFPQVKTLPSSTKKIIEIIQNQLLTVGNVQRTDSLDEVMLPVLSGNTALFVNGTTTVLTIDSQGWKTRAIAEPTTETLIRGPRDGFIEDIGTNLAHIRRRIRDPNLRIHTYRVGRRSKNRLSLVFIEGIIHPSLVKEIKRRLKTIDLADAPESAFIEQWIEDSFLSPFPQIQHSERPDTVTAALEQGKFAILLDGTPFVLYGPTVFSNLLQSPSDYYHRWMFGTLIRILRYFASFNAMFLPSLYIALLSYHPGMLPAKLAFSIASTREGVPYPAFVEAFLMEITMELIREAGIRLPKPVGQTVSIVGGLVLGEAAIQAGVVSPIMVMIVSITALSSFAVPAFNLGLTFRLLRFATMIAASTFGFFGIMLVYITVNIHIVNLKSFGIPYSTPYGPAFWKDLKDTVLRAPLLMLGKRPVYLQTEDKVRKGKGGQDD